MSNNQAVQKTVYTFPLFFILLILKLTETVTWSWWIITLPLYGPLLLILAVMALFFVIGGIAFTCAYVADKVTKR